MTGPTPKERAGTKAGYKGAPLLIILNRKSPSEVGPMAGVINVGSYHRGKFTRVLAKISTTTTSVVVCSFDTI